MVNGVIGIISYLPEDEKIRGHRFSKLCSLLSSCNYIFSTIPIIIIAQNWKPENLNKLKGFNRVTAYEYPKLGIVGARNKLREHFIQSNYNYLIMLDDDVQLYGNKAQGMEYLRQLSLHRDGFWEFNLTLLKLFAISKSLFEKEKFDDNINPENGDGFEDRIFVNKLRVKYPNLRYIFKVPGLNQVSISTKDVDSTWYVNQDIKDMREKTNQIIDNLQTKLNDSIKN